MHDGYDLEAGMLARVREWVDLLPWARLFRVARVAGSPPLLAMVAVTLAAWIPGIEFLAGDEASTGNGPVPQGADASPQAAPAWSSTLETLRRSLPGALFEPGSSVTGWTRRVAIVLWTLAIWPPVILVLIRQGALLSCGRDLADFSAVASQTLRRTPAAWVAAIVPVTAVALIGLGFVLVGWIERLAGGLGWAEPPIAVGLLALAIPCGVIALGANVAVPLAWAAIANEPEPDPLDALSRGYEYLYRRPLHVVAYVAVSLVPLTILDGLARAVATAAGFVAESMIGGVPAPTAIRSPLTTRLLELLAYLPVVVSLTVAGSLLGGVYLLLRQDAGGQEPEDLWAPPPGDEAPLPELPAANDP